MHSHPASPTVFLGIAAGRRAAGRRAAFLASLGVGSGCPVHATASSVGLSAILARPATAFEVVKAVGAVYLVFLGVRALLAARRPEGMAPSGQGHGSSACPMLPQSVFLRRLGEAFARSAFRRSLEALTGAVLLALGVKLALEKRQRGAGRSRGGGGP